MTAPEVTSAMTVVHAQQAKERKKSVKKKIWAAVKALKRLQLLRDFEKNDQPRRREMSLEGR